MKGVTVVPMNQATKQRLEKFYAPFTEQLGPLLSQPQFTAGWIGGGGKRMKLQ